MKGGITLVLVLLASITIGEVDALRCYNCDGPSQDTIINSVCQGEDDLGKLVECTGWCQKMTVTKTGEVFLTKDSGLACLDCQLIPNFLTICSY